MRSVFGVFLLILGLLSAASAQATVRVEIDLTRQKMDVTSGSGDSFTWPVSSARSGYVTPRGTFAPYSLQRMHFSHKYHMSPMPYSIFFAGGYAIHGTYSVAQLGRPASHGCIRLSPTHAAQLFAMVKAEGASISISGTPPGGAIYAHKSHGTRYAASQHHPRYYRQDNPGYGMAYAPARALPGTIRMWQWDPSNTRW